MEGYISVTLPDGSRIEVERGSTVRQVAEELSQRLAREAVAARVDGVLRDLEWPLEKDCRVELVMFDSEEGQKVFRHTSSHIMAQAVQRIYPEARLAIGPAIENGFYYDFEVPKSFTPEDLEKIEEEMGRIVKEDYPVRRQDMTREEALEFFRRRGDHYKVELLEDMEPGTPVSVYWQGEFVDLCSGPHLPSTGKVRAYKLTSLAGSYWRGDEKRQSLQRIYGTSFPKKQQLEEHLHLLEEAARRDHRRLGKELGLFSLQQEAPGFPFFHPRGMVLRQELEAFWREVHQRYGYREIKTPMLLSQELWERSGHWDHYRENMYITRIDDQDFAIKPMNCPGGMLVYKSGPHSYRDFPLRLAELGLVHRHELSGVLHGLMRVRSFTQDDAHIFMLPQQVKDEIKEIIGLTDYLYRIFGFPYHVELSTRPEKAMGSVEVWDRATGALREALEEMEMDYQINEGDGAFYGPKIDFHLQDCLGRTWQCGTIQLDFLMPERFDLEYVGEDGEKHRPVTIHRTCLGSIERFIGILIEHYAGAFPAWLAPVQARVIPVADRHAAYGDRVRQSLQDRGVRAELDQRREKVGYKIREAEVQKVPYMLVVGDKEVAESTVSVRSYSQGDLGAMSMPDFQARVLEEIQTREDHQPAANR